MPNKSSREKNGKDGEIIFKNTDIQEEKPRTKARSFRIERAQHMDIQRIQTRKHQHKISDQKKGKDPIGIMREKNLNKSDKDPGIRMASDFSKNLET